MTGVTHLTYPNLSKHRARPGISITYLSENRPGRLSCKTAQGCLTTAAGFSRGPQNVNMHPVRLTVISSDEISNLPDFQSR